MSLRALVASPRWRPLLLWALIALVLIAMNAGNIAARHFPDPDDTLRLVQVRDLLAGQSWFDLRQYRLDPPHGTLMHWSRLVDVPLALAIGLLTPLVGAAQAELITLVAVPLLTLLAIILVVDRIARRFFDLEATVLAGLCVGLAPLLGAQVQPLRIDHHGWQIFTVMFALLGLLPRAGWRGAVLSAVALAAGMSISLELLPVTAAFAAVFALAWLDARKDARPLAAFLTTFATGLAGLFLATRGLSDVAIHCDIVSPAHLAFFAIVAASVSGLAAIRAKALPAVLGGLISAGAAGLAAFLWLAPECAAGPFGMLDPLVKAYWYNSVMEGLPAWQSPLNLAGPAIAQGLLGLAVLAYLWRSNPDPEKRRWWLGYLVVAAACFATGLLLWRGMAFVGALSAVPLGWLAAQLFGAFRRAERTGPKLATACALLLTLVPSFPGAMVKTFTPAPAVAQVAPEKNMAGDSCGLPASAGALARLPAGTIFAPMDVGPAILVDTRHAVVASSHHRAQLAMRDVILAFTGSEARAHALVRAHRATYLLACDDLIELQFYRGRAPSRFAAQLAAGKVPAWLEPVALEGAGSMRLWRVRS